MPGTLPVSGRHGQEACPGVTGRSPVRWPLAPRDGRPDHRATTRPSTRAAFGWRCATPAGFAGADAGQTESLDARRGGHGQVPGSPGPDRSRRRHHPRRSGGHRAPEHGRAHARDRLGGRRPRDAPLHRASAARDLRPGRHRRPDDQHVLVGAPQPGAARPRGSDDRAQHPGRRAGSGRARQGGAGSARLHRWRSLELRARDRRGASPPRVRHAAAPDGAHRRADAGQSPGAGGDPRRGGRGLHARGVDRGHGAPEVGGGGVPGDGPSHLDRDQVPGRG